MNKGFDVTGKTALVTGANRGIGLAIVHQLITSGVDKVYLAVRQTASVQPLIAQYADKVVVVEMDLTNASSINRAAHIAEDVELVINNAGILINATALDSEAISTLETQININVIGLMRVAQAFAPVLAKNGGGALVQLNSVASLRAFPDFATYAASKAASYSITQSLRAQLAPQGTLVLSVHPGPIATDMANEAGLADIADPPEVVAEGIVGALKRGDFHLFPDTMAQSLWEHYQGFAEVVIEAEAMD